jgi:L-ascorbate metabolism protein UlaG (beta-lactamase superfamily)
LEIHFIRHATLVVSIKGISFLIDPMLSPAKAWDPIPDTPNPQRNPLVDLPFGEHSLGQLLEEIEGVLVTHAHFDHWDAKAKVSLPKDIPVLCQPEDVPRLHKAGFTSPQPIGSEYAWKGIQIIRTGGQHGTGEIGQRMGRVSGFVLRGEGEPSLYIAGDTIWCSEVEQALMQHQPEVVVVNAGAAQFSTGDPITMTAEDVVHVCKTLPGARVIAVHMEAINHCLLTRRELAEELRRAGLEAQVEIPLEGERIQF